MVPMSMQAAIEMGILKQLDDPAASPSATTSTTNAQPKAAEVQPEAAVEAEQNKALKSAARAELFDDQAQQDLSNATDAMERSGLNPAAEIASMISTGVVNPVTLDAIAEGLNVEPEVALKWISDAGKHVTGTMTDALVAQGHEEADALALMVEAAEANPQAWIAAATASVHAGSIILLMRALAQHVEHRLAHGG